MCIVLVMLSNESFPECEHSRVVSGKRAVRNPPHGKNGRRFRAQRPPKVQYGAKQLRSLA